jgi:hypothetical protein
MEESLRFIFQICILDLKETQYGSSQWAAVSGQQSCSMLHSQQEGAKMTTFAVKTFTTIQCVSQNDYYATKASVDKQQ